MGIDATIPENVPRSRYNRIVYFNQGKVDINDFVGTSNGAATAVFGPSPMETVDTLAEEILGVLQNSPQFYAELLALYPNTGCRTIASAMGQLQRQGKIVQNGDGRYQEKKYPGTD
jgi:hypothetical protein